MRCGRLRHLPNARVFPVRRSLRLKVNSHMQFCPSTVYGFCRVKSFPDTPAPVTSVLPPLQGPRPTILKLALNRRPVDALGHNTHYILGSKLGPRREVSIWTGTVGGASSAELELSKGKTKCAGRDLRQAMSDWPQ